WFMKRCLTYVVSVLLLVGLLVSCGGGGDSSDGSGGGNAGGGAVSNPGRFEETDPNVTLSPGHWIPADSKFGWSGGAAVRTTVADATVMFTFTGKSVTWLGERNGDAGIAEVRVDGGPARRVDLFARVQEARTPIVTLHDLSPGQHTLTIRFTGDRNP